MKLQISSNTIKRAIKLITIFIPKFTTQVLQNFALIMAGKHEPNILFWCSKYYIV